MEPIYVVILTVVGILLAPLLVVLYGLYLSKIAKWFGLE